jgi:drug/metabolite transporter (DMT)-like permease
MMRGQDIGRLLLLSALWGGSFIFIRVAAPVLGPVVLVWVRVLLAGLLLLAYAWGSRRSIEFRRHWRQYLMLGLFNSALPFLLISTAELHLSASLAAMLNATSPLFGAIIAFFWLRDPFTPRKLAGLALGILGVAILAGWSPITLDTVVLFSILASLAGAASYGLASVYTKARVSNIPALSMAAGSQLAAGLLLSPLVPFTWPAAAPSMTVVLCTLALAIASTALAYLLFFRLVVDVGPTKALTVTFLVPVFGVLWGALFLGEPVGISTVIGGLVVLAGTALVVGVRLPQFSRRVQSEPASR